MKKEVIGLFVAAVASAVAIVPAAAIGGFSQGSKPSEDTASPIQHVVVIFQENVSYDHYFATYPYALNPGAEPTFYAEKGTPTVNGLDRSLLAPNNPNSTQPFRLDRSQYETCDQNHDYTPEQRALDAGLVDKYPESTGTGNSASYPCSDYGKGPGLVMGYYDGNTVTALWNYAQSFSMNDNSFGTTFGPSTPGALNLVSGQTFGATPAAIPDEVSNGTVIGDPDPTGDICSHGTTVKMSGRNIGDMLTSKNITWGWFQGGFREAPGAATCAVSHSNLAGVSHTDYSAHHEPFQYYASTANPMHLPPSSVSDIGRTDQANHQYDLSDFWAAVNTGHMPAVSFLKARAFQDGHAGYSDPLDEQFFLANTINHLERTQYWHNTAVIINWDDSDGWYDHVMPPIVNHSQDPAYDALQSTAGSTTNGLCGLPTASTNAPAGVMGPYQDRCGYGPRLPLLVISPYAKENFVDNTLTDQSSILRFIEENWGLGLIGNGSFDQKAGPLTRMFTFPGSGPVGGNNKLFLNPCTGEPGSGSSDDMSPMASAETSCRSSITVR